MTQFFLISVFFNFGRKKNENLSFKNGHYSTICGHFFGTYIEIFHNTEIQTVILRYLVCLNLNWIKSNNTILAKVLIFSCLEIHYFRAGLPKSVLTFSKETSSHWFKIALFPKILGLSRNT